MFSLKWTKWIKITSNIDNFDTQIESSVCFAKSLTKMILKMAFVSKLLLIINLINRNVQKWVSKTHGAPRLLTQLIFLCVVNFLMSFEPWEFRSAWRVTAFDDLTVGNLRLADTSWEKRIWWVSLPNAENSVMNSFIQIRSLRYKIFEAM